MAHGDRSGYLAATSRRASRRVKLIDGAVEDLVADGGCPLLRGAAVGVQLQLGATVVEIVRVLPAGSVTGAVARKRKARTAPAR